MTCHLQIFAVLNYLFATSDALEHIGSRKCDVALSKSSGLELEGTEPDNDTVKANPKRPETLCRESDLEIFMLGTKHELLSRSKVPETKHILILNRIIDGHLQPTARLLHIQFSPLSERLDRNLWALALFQVARVVEFKP